MVVVRLICLEIDVSDHHCRCKQHCSTSCYDRDLKATAMRTVLTSLQGKMASKKVDLDYINTANAEMLLSA